MSVPRLMPGTAQQLLDCPLDPERNDHAADTVRKFLVDTLHKIHQDGHSYDGKYAYQGRWDYILMEGFVDGGFMYGEWEYDDGRRFSVENWDRVTLNALITRAIDGLYSPWAP